MIRRNDSSSTPPLPGFELPPEQSGRDDVAAQIAAQIADQVAAQIATKLPELLAAAREIPPEGLDREQVCQLLGIGITTFKKWLRRKQFGPRPAYKVGKVLRWSRQEVQAWIDDGRSSSRAMWDISKPERFRRRHPG